MDSVCSQRHVSDVCDTSSCTDKGGNNENSPSQQHVDEGAEPVGTDDERQDIPLSSSSLNTSISNIPKAIPTNEADMICTTVENVLHVRFEWTVEDFYPQM